MIVIKSRSASGNFFGSSEKSNAPRRDACCVLDVIDAEHSGLIIVSEDLPVSAPGNHCEQCLFRVALAQMIFKFRLESDSRSRLTLAFL